MAAHGIISEFSSARIYFECLQQYQVANKVKDADQQRTILLGVCGPATYRCLWPSNLQAYPEFGVPQEADGAEIPGHCGPCHKA